MDTNKQSKFAHTMNKMTDRSVKHMEIHVPELSVVAIIGDDLSNQALFAKKYFKKEEIFSIAEEKKVGRRLKLGQLAVVYISFTDEQESKQIITLGKKYHVTPIGILVTKESTNESKEVLQRVEKLNKMGFKQVYKVNMPSELDKVTVKRVKLSNNKRDLKGPFDLIGDVHGCYDELCELLEKLGYEVDAANYKVTNKSGRTVVFCGDLVDRGPKIVEVLKLVMHMVAAGTAYTVMGNHDSKLQRKLHGANVKVIHGLEATLKQLEKEPEEFIKKLSAFLDGLVSHYVFDEGKLVVAHAGLKEHLHGRESKAIKDLAMFGETTGKFDEHGFPIRLDWSEHYKGKALVVYGHTPRLNPRMNNYTINIDTGCVYGGKLTAFRYPEQEIVDVKARATYYESTKPIV